MTEKEKEAIEIIKLIINISKKNERTTAIIYVSDEEKILTLIDKLQKENEDREQAHMKLYNEFRQYKDWDSIPKDKIREKIEQEEKLLESGEPRGAYGVIKYREGKVQALKELLEEMVE